MLRFRCSDAAAPVPLLRCRCGQSYNDQKMTRSASYTLSLLSSPVVSSLSPLLHLGFLV
ncbi:unnamed protein product [Ectocarpus sp. CCAP 1310/34]|nr:unnamed protein product [Ectocarpus sp. CCAP 1310/34]